LGRTVARAAVGSSWATSSWVLRRAGCASPGSIRDAQCQRHSAGAPSPPVVPVRKQSAGCDPAAVVPVIGAGRGLRNRCSDPNSGVNRTTRFRTPTITAWSPSRLHTRLGRSTPSHCRPSATTLRRRRLYFHAFLPLAFAPLIVRVSAVGQSLVALRRPPLPVWPAHQLPCSATPGR
jgi:hypothetical protein